MDIPAGAELRWNYGEPNENGGWDGVIGHVDPPK
jgi:hypothetical protein